MSVVVALFWIWLLGIGSGHLATRMTGKEGTPAEQEVYEQLVGGVGRRLGGSVWGGAAFFSLLVVFHPVIAWCIAVRLWRDEFGWSPPEDPG